MGLAMQIEIDDAFTRRIQALAKKQALPCNVVVRQLLEIGLEAKEAKAKPRRKAKPDWVKRAADRAAEMPRATTLKKAL
jgi:predicted transcriptional regulator